MDLLKLLFHLDEIQLLSFFDSILLEFLISHSLSPKMLLIMFLQNLVKFLSFFIFVIMDVIIYLNLNYFCL